MKIVFLQPPGRFPTVVQDLGKCWDSLLAEGAECVSFNANAEWWKKICSRSYIALLAVKFPLQEIISSKLSPKATPEALAKAAESAGGSLEAMKGKENYSDAVRYAGALKPFSDYIRLLNYLQPEFRIKVYCGPEGDCLDYSSSAALAEYASGDTLLAASLEAAIAGFPSDADACLLYVTSSHDLLTALIAARLIRQRNPGVYLSIASHSYENFSLDRSAEAMARNGAVFGLVDSIIKFGFQRDEAVPYLVRELAAGRRPSGFIEYSGGGTAIVKPGAAQPLTEVFSPEPVFWTRLSGKRCYWSRCNFCVQNAKHMGGEPPSEADIDSALLRISGLIERGCRYFYFWDEAVLPRLLEHLCGAIADKGMGFKWGCRCRIDAGYSREFFLKLKAAGCYEVLFGVESVAPRVQRLMNKYERVLEEGEIKRVTDMVKSAGLGIHLTFLTCFPGERIEETGATIRFIASALKDAELGTYYINRFSLFPGSDVFNNPAKYGIAVRPLSGDITAPCAYSFLEEGQRLENDRVCSALPELVAATERELGWSNLEDKPELKLSRDFYFNYGHGAFIKSSGIDIFKAIRFPATGGK